VLEIDECLRSAIHRVLASESVLWS
jgi:hypothetical protein